MAITESDQRVIRELFMEAGAKLLEEERVIVEGRIDARLAKIEERLGELGEAAEGVISALDRLEDTAAEMNLELARLNLNAKLRVVRRKARGG